ncbi:extracellular solute-binding protein [Atopomonas hussainii]|uniref:extracellular solute-binding protein n=1 Tax=Atopomonas hussainii TaxID=1429083 RepID=UPI0009000A94|nr:extracellular solute-binding protein [Atopomonas hussainii]
MTRNFIAAGALLACFSSAQAAEPVVRVLNWADYFAPNTLHDFQQETGIRVIYDVMDSSEVLEAKLMTGGSGYDLIFPGDTVAERLARAGSLQPLVREQLQHYADVSAGLRALHAQYPQSQAATVPYTWGSIGITFNAEQVAKRIANPPLASLDLLFKPEYAAKLADCGISVVDSPDEVLAVALNYLGRDPRSGQADDLRAAEQLLLKLRPYVRKFQSQPVTELVNGDLCVSLGYSGDAIQAQRAAVEAGRTADFQYRLPKEGTTVWMDTMAIPKDAPHPEAAYALINFLMRPERMAEITNFTGYPTANGKAQALIDPQLANNPDIYPSAEAYQRLIPGQDIPLKVMRKRLRTWNSIKTARAD